jgi:hypothetical protein
MMRRCVLGQTRARTRNEQDPTKDEAQMTKDELRLIARRATKL